MLCIIAQTKIDERILSFFFFLKELIAFVCLCLQGSQGRILHCIRLSVIMF